MNKNYLIAGGVAVALYFLFFKKKKATTDEAGGGAGGGGGVGGGGGGSLPLPTGVQGTLEYPTEKKGTQVIKGKSDVVEKGDRPPIDSVSMGSGIPSGVGIPTTSTGSGTGVAVSTGKLKTSGAITPPIPKTQTTYDPVSTGGTVKMPPLGGSGGIIPVTQGGSRVPLGGANIKLPPNMMFTGDTEFADFVETISRANFN